MQLVREISAARSYRDIARMLFRHLSGRSRLRAIAVQDSLGLWHTYPGRRPRLDTEGFATLTEPRRVALKLAVKHPLRAIARKIETLMPIIQLKLESIDLHGKLARTSLFHGAEQRVNHAAGQKERRRLRREIDETIGIFSRHSHDLKTPLSLITIPLETMVLSEEKIPAKLRLRLENLKIAIYATLRGVTNTLDAARVLGGRRKTILTPHNLSDFVRKVAEVYAIVFESYGIELKTQITPNVIAEIDPLQLEKVLNNLFSNAIKHNLPGSIATVEVRLMRGAAEISVADGGLGISYAANSISRDQEKVRGGWAFSSHGFGLKIVRELVRANRGRFSLSSKTGVGTTATVRLPIIKNYQIPEGTSLRPFRFDHTMHEVELLAAERTALSRRPKI